MIKFVLAAAWICLATLGAVFYAFQAAGAKSADAASRPASIMGGLDYVKTEVISVPLVRDSVVHGYFLARLVYTVEPAELRKLVVPAEALITDAVYSYIYSSPLLDLRKQKTLDLEAFRAGIRDGINKRVGQNLVQDVLIEQVDYLTKDEIRANAAKRRKPGGDKIVTFGKREETGAPDEAASAD
ncbi:hypothetical protein [Kumtagia ephedrae]|uniref:hypothetical protein n=1 Tax=Kumtagia ephedrae TaxID=2116701 RepID=UPI001FE07E4E|nr:hypothetical protein [Mesorhizobium ephedrae]